MRFGLGLGLTSPRNAVVEPASVASIAGLYGTGLGQVPVLFDPATATVDGADAVIGTFPNSGGAGAAYDGAWSFTGTITRAGGYLNVPASTLRALSLATPFEMVGTRVALVAAVDPAATGMLHLAGRSTSTAPGGRTNLRWDMAGNAFSLQWWNGTAFETFALPAGAPLGTDPRLIEIEIAAGVVRAFVNGALHSAESGFVWPSLPIGLLFKGYGSQKLHGRVGKVLALNVDGNQAEAIAVVRGELSAAYGIALP